MNAFKLLRARVRGCCRTIDLNWGVVFMITEQLKTLKQETIPTPRGLIILEGPVQGEYIADFELEEKLDNFRQPPKQKKALMEIADSPDGQVFIARHNNTVIAYISFHYPDEYSRWIKHPSILEIGRAHV